MMRARRGRGGGGGGWSGLLGLAVGLALMASSEPVSGQRLGPVDGQDLPATDPERVAVGTLAPDFRLETLEGDTLGLSEFRGKKDVILVFYRGWW